jgi:uncharacterized membrane protein
MSEATLVYWSLAVVIGIVAGLRAMTAPAAIALLEDKVAIGAAVVVVLAS